MKITIKRKISLYESLIKKYGDYGNKNSPTEVNGLGIKIFPDGTQFVINARTGRPMKRDKSIRYLGRSEHGFHFFIPEDEALKKLDQPFHSYER